MKVRARGERGPGSGVRARFGRLGRRALDPLPDPAGRRTTRRQAVRWAAGAGAAGLLGAAFAGYRFITGPGGPSSAGPREPRAVPSPAPATATPAPLPTVTAVATAQAAAPQPTPTPRLVEPSVQRLPVWRGFNLQEKFKLEWGNERFRQRDFEWIAEMGFNFVRLPMDYRAWTDPNDWTVLREAALKEIDEAVRFGERYQVHVCLNFHRAPGYTVSQPAEPRSLWTDEAAQRVCALHWGQFAKRYQGIPSSRLSFNLLNEPPHLDPEVHRTVVARVLEAIRKEDPQRLVICDGADGGNTPPMELLGTSVAAAMRGYDPMRLTHYDAEWIDGAGDWEKPTYPLREGSAEWRKETLRQARIDPWRALEARGMGVMVGEFGAYSRTPHHVVLAWMRDCLQLWQDAGWGWALWNFRGPFGVLDSGRPDVKYQNWRGHKLDRAMLELMQSFSPREQRTSV